MTPSAANLMAHHAPWISRAVRRTVTPRAARARAVSAGSAMRRTRVVPGFPVKRASAAAASRMARRAVTRGRVAWTTTVLAARSVPMGTAAAVSWPRLRMRHPLARPPARNAATRIASKVYVSLTTAVPVRGTWTALGASIARTTPKYATAPATLIPIPASEPGRQPERTPCHDRVTMPGTRPGWGATRAAPSTPPSRMKRGDAP